MGWCRDWEVYVVLFGSGMFVVVVVGGLNWMVVFEVKALM